MRAQHPAVAWIFSLLAVAFVPSAAGADCNIQLPNGTPAGWFTYFSKLPYPYWGDCRIDPGVDTLVVQINAIPFERVRFTLPDPPFGTVVGENWYFSHSGDRLSGLELEIGDCATAGTVQLGEIYVSADYNVVSPSICAAWSVGPGEVQNCSGRWLPASGIGQYLGGVNAYDCQCSACWQCSYNTQPYDLYPPDGATNVPLDVTLTWEGSAPVPDCYVFISSDPTCSTFQNVKVLQCGTFDPGLLTPNTTYYWRPYWYLNDGWGTGATAAVHSFKTMGDVAVEQSTWGRVKALYRN